MTGAGYDMGAAPFLGQADGGDEVLFAPHGESGLGDAMQPLRQAALTEGPQHVGGCAIGQVAGHRCFIGAELVEAVIEGIGNTLGEQVRGPLG